MSNYFSAINGSNTPYRAHTASTSTTAVTITLSANCRRIRLKGHTQDHLFTIGIEPDSGKHFLDKLHEGFTVDVPPNTTISVETLTGHGTVYVTELINA
jgi:hypothetical protein